LADDKLVEQFGSSLGAELQRGKDYKGDVSVLHSALGVVVALTLRSNGRHEDDRERQEQVILHQTPGRRSEVQLAIVKRIVQAGHLRRDDMPARILFICWVMSCPALVWNSADISELRNE
jgi:hypothetical protein